MERGHEGRRGAGGGGLVHAPRRPRTGFKDAAVGYDADDLMDDVHNSRLRERAKKDGIGASGGHAVATSIVGPSSRNKRKRQGSQEMQVQARNSPADEVETTEDTEMGVSEDDDDPPPPIIPRRPGKPRPPAKFAEDGVAVGPPAVPRKARTAIGKRQPDTAAASVAECAGHVAITAAVAMPVPSSTPSSLSIASLNPGRRTKPSGSKSRGHKVAKVSVSEQEVEVAEALFDLARMFTQPSASGSAAGSKAEAKATAKETKVGGSNLAPEAPNGAGVVPSGPSAGGASPATVGVSGSVRSKSSGVGSGASPAPSPAVAAAAPGADGAKRKRPKARNRTQEGCAVPSRTGPSPARAGASGVSPAEDAYQSTSRALRVERNVVKAEGGETATVGVLASANSVAGTASSAAGVGGASSGMNGLDGGAASGQGGAAGGTVTGAMGGAVGRGEKIGVEKKGVHTEKKVGSGGGKAEEASSNSGEKRERKGVNGEAAAGGLAAKANGNAESEAAASTSAGVGAAAVKTEVDERTPEAAAGPSDADRVAKRDIDLMAVPSMAGGAASGEKDGEGRERDAGDASGKRVVDAAAVEEKQRVEGERGRERERERELERERAERERRREAESARESVKEASEEREREKEKETAELSKVGMPVQRPGKSAKPENGRAQKGADRAGSGAAIGAATMVGSAGPGPGGAGADGHVAVLPMSVGMLSWPAGMAGGLGYFPGAAVAAAEDSSPAVQVGPLMVGARGTTWKRCAQHVYIARFIDMQQQLNRHRSFFTGGIQTYPKSYNLNLAVGPSESLIGGAGGGVAAGGVAASGSTGGGGVEGANVKATERGLNVAVMAAAAAASMQGVKERVAYGMETVSRKSAGQHQGSGQGAAALSVQSGAMFGFPIDGIGSPSGGSGGGGGGMGGTNLNLPPGPGVVGGAMSLGGGSSSALVLGAGGPVGGSASGGGGGAAASAAMQQAQYMQAMMQQAQSGSFPFAQFPGHFGAAPFSEPAAHMGAQQAATQFFAPGGYYAHHLVAQSQQQGGQQSGGAGPVVKAAQQQGGSRGSSGAGAAPGLPGSHPAVQGAAGWVGGREGSAVGENWSSEERKYAIARGGAQGSGEASVVSGVSGGRSVHGGGGGGAGAAEYNLTGGLGKQSKSRGSGQGQEQNHGGVGGRKGMEGATSLGLAVSMNMAAAMSSREAAVGPGLLGLAPVAAVMAPQGHAMIQSMAESGRGQGEGGGSGQAQMVGGAGHSSMMQQQRHQQLLQLQQTQQQHFQAQAQAQQSQQQHQQQQQRQGALNARSSGEDGHGGADASSGIGGGQRLEREGVEERKSQGKRAASSGGASAASREFEAGGGMQPFAGGSGGGSRSTGATVNSMAATHAGMSVRSSGQSGGALSAGAAMATQVQAGATAGSKAGGGRANGSEDAGAGTGPSGGTVGRRGQVGAHGGLAERVAVGAAESVAADAGAKASSTRELSLGGQNVATGLGERQGQQAGAKASQSGSERPAPGSGTTAAPTAPGTDLQAALAAAIAKNLQGQQGQQAQRAAQEVSGNANANANATVNANSGPSGRIGTAMAGAPTSSGGGAVASPAKSSGANPAKSSPGKSAFPASGKNGGAGKRALSPSSAGSAPSRLGPSPVVQNMSSKSSQQVQAAMQGQVQGQAQGVLPGQLAPAQLLQQQQFYQLQQQQQQVFLHQQQLQQYSHVQGSMSGPLHSQAAQQGSQHQQQPGAAGQAQQDFSNQQLQALHMHVQQQASHTQQQFGGPGRNGSLAFGSGPSMGGGSGGGGRSSHSEAGSGGLIARALQSAKAAGSGSNATPTGWRFVGAGPAILQQSGSPRGGSASGYLQAQGNASSGAAGRASDGKNFPDGGQGQANGVRMAHGSGQARGGATMAASGGVQGSSQRPQSNGSSRGPSGGGGPTEASGGRQSNGFGDVGQLRMSMVVSNAGHGSGSGGGLSSGGTNVQSVGSGRPAFSGGSLHGEGSGQGQLPAASSLAGTGAAVVPCGPGTVMGPPVSTSVVRQ